MIQSLADQLTAAADWYALRSIRASRVRLFLRLAVAVRGDMTVADFIAALATSEDESRPAHARVYRRIEARMRDGEHSLVQALRDVCGPDDLCFFVAEHKVSDVSVLFQMAHDAAVRKKRIVKSATAPFVFPTYMAIMAFGVLVLGGTVMLPNFVKVLPVSQFEMPTQVVYHVGRVLRDNTLGAGLLLAAGLVWIRWSLPNLFNSVRIESLDRVFPWSLYRVLQSSSFLVSMASLFKAKVPVLDAVTGYAMVARPYEAGYANLMRENLESEQTTSDMWALDVGFIEAETMTSMRILNVKLAPEEVIQRIGDSEMALLAEDVAMKAQRIARTLTLVLAVVLTFSLYGTFSVIPTLAEKASTVHGLRK